MVFNTAADLTINIFTILIYLTGFFPIVIQLCMLFYFNTVTNCNIGSCIYMNEHYSIFRFCDCYFTLI